MHWPRGQPSGLYAELEGAPYGVLALDVQDGVISGVRLVVNPDKLRHVAASATSR